MNDPGRTRAGKLTASAISLVLWCWLAGVPTCLLAALPEISLTSPEKLLLIDEAQDRDGAISVAAVSCEILMRFGRLIPENAAAEQIRQLAQMLRPGTKADENGIPALVKDFPPADKLLFDGEGYAGGNFGFIDAIIGAQGRPIALDREPPMFLVPLPAGAAEALSKRREAFQVRRNPHVLHEIDVDSSLSPDGAGGAPPAEMMSEDGEYIRPYCGRFDDLYFHLFQNGNAVSALAFLAVADELSERRYHPLTGLVDQKIGPPLRFNLNDILSSGGLSAIRAYVSRIGARETTAFKGFAYRVMPLIVERVGASNPGDVLKVEAADVLRAMHGGQRLYPTLVPPLYVSPDRFFGWAGSLCVPVVDRFSLPQGSMDSYCPLPNRNTNNRDETRTEDKNASDGLFMSSSTSELMWEDPQNSDLLSDPRELKKRKRSSKLQRGKTGTGGFLTVPRPSDLNREGRQTGETAPAFDPSRLNESPSAKDDRTHSMPPFRLIAVVTPTSADTAAYFAAIQSNDDRLRAAEQLLGRTQKLRSELKRARASLTGGSGGDLAQAIADDLTSLDRWEKETRAELLNALGDRADVRALLERRLLEERIPSLQSLGKNEGKTGSPE